MKKAKKLTIYFTIYCFYKNKVVILFIMGDNKKNSIINDVYYDRAGFGSKKQTLKDAKEKDKTITMADVDNFLEKMLNRRSR